MNERFKNEKKQANSGDLISGKILLNLANRKSNIS